MKMAEREGDVHAALLRDTFVSSTFASLGLANEIVEPSGVLSYPLCHKKSPQTGAFFMARQR